MRRSLFNSVSLSLVWLFVTYRFVYLGGSLFSIPPYDPFFIGLTVLAALAAVATLLTTMGKIFGGYLGLIFVLADVSWSGKLISTTDPAWKPELLRGIVADLLFGAVLFLAIRTRPRLGR